LQSVEQTSSAVGDHAIDPFASGQLDDRIAVEPPQLEQFIEVGMWSVQEVAFVSRGHVGDLVSVRVLDHHRTPTVYADESVYSDASARLFQNFAVQSADSLEPMREGSKFTDQQWFAGLLPEVTSARSVLASADRLLRRDGTLERDLDAVLATYSIGVERLM